MLTSLFRPTTHAWRHMHQDTCVWKKCMEIYAWSIPGYQYSPPPLVPPIQGHKSHACSSASPHLPTSCTLTLELPHTHSWLEFKGMGEHVRFEACPPECEWVCVCACPCCAVCRTCSCCWWRAALVSGRGPLLSADALGQGAMRPASSSPFCFMWGAAAPFHWVAQNPAA